MKIQVNVGLQPFQQYFVYIGWRHLDAILKLKPVINEIHFYPLLLYLLSLKQSSYNPAVIPNTFYCGSIVVHMICERCENSGDV